MTPVLRPVATIAIFYLPVLAALVAAVRLRRTHRAGKRVPFTDQPLRLPGESARERADSLWDSANEKMLLILLGCPALGAAYALAPGRKPFGLGVALFALSAVCTWSLWRRLRIGLLNSWAWRLGAAGEQVVGRELDRLIAQGYEIYHDVPFLGWNVDHIVVGPAGVFAVETKTRRKPAVKGGGAAVVHFDGERLSWLGRPDDASVAQARRNASSLEQWIAKAAAERVSVVPVLAIPGWLLKIEKYGDVAVYSATGMSEHLSKRGRDRLDSGQIQRIAFQLARICEVKPGAATA